MNAKYSKRIILVCLLALILSPLASAQAQSSKKGLLVYSSIYGSTVETAYWVKALIGIENQLDVKSLSQVITIEPYDYIIIGSVTRNEGPVEPVYQFMDLYKDKLVNKQVCYYLNCGDTDETMVLKVPGREAHLIAGRNYLIDLLNKYPEIKPVAIGGFGGRQVFITMNKKDSFMTWLVGMLAKEGKPWEGLDIWESLVPERVEAFANEVRVNILGLKPREDVKQFRGYWESLQPASLTDPAKQKFHPKPYTEKVNTDRIYYSRSRIKGDLELTVSLLQQWAKENGIELKEQVKTFYNVYYHAVKNYGEGDIITHIVPATLPEDPGNVHISFRCYDKPDKRSGVEKDIELAEKLVWADGRKIDN